MNSSRKQNLLTLDPEKLVESDFVQCLYFTVRYQNVSSMAYSYNRPPAVKGKSNGRPLPFPTGSHGQIYLHGPPKVHSCAASLRFRICDFNLLPPQEAFYRGKDMLLPNVAPWEMNMLQLLTRTPFTNVREGLLLDGLLSEEALSQLDGVIAAHKKGTRFRNSSYLFVPAAIQCSNGLSYRQFDLC
ncbi:hypothetical protein BDP27DRAFT_596125 [Rhodocollybia butyracea]|uniref:Uncharacterized protein n=1 Tax=Rhodocollybia butyracea TaxID=206335 RepID=A0A9P5P8R6_9AGAR|nr:hypothetical protein BDP27DRAFT_596125 [Rhodocollybia butyracea]